MHQADPSRVSGALVVIDLLMDNDRVTMGDVSAALGVSRSSAHRLLTDLVVGGYAVLGATGRGYSAGGKLLARTRTDALDPQVRLRIRPVLQELRDVTGESVHSATLSGDQVLVIDGRRSAYPLDIGLRIGMIAPAHTMAAGKLLLAGMTDATVAHVLRHDPLARPARASLGTRDEVYADLTATRRRGWAKAVQESEPGVSSIAVPLDGASWRSRIALVVSVPIQRGAARRLEELASQAHQVARSHELAGRIRPWRFG